MHVPDGYLSPATCGVMYAAAVPFWAVAVARVKKFIGGRTVPLLAIFSAFTFTVMMFNVPVPGGTTAHGVGGTFTAIVLGPWAAVLTTSVALIIQALFFGDGGITAIGANCFNMGVLLPFTGYFVYRLVAGRSAKLSQRRIVAAAAGSYIGITVAAVAVGIELGIQPHLWSHNGVPDYSPYGFSTAIPAMLISHMLGASFVEAAVTALGFAYLQRAYPEIIMRRRDGAPTGDDEARGSRLNPGLVGAGLAASLLLIVFFGELIRSGGDITSWAGLDWSTVNWTDAWQTALVSAIVSVVLLPVLWMLLRGYRAWRTPALIFIGLLIWVPIGLIAPGTAFGEDESVTPAELQAALNARANGDSSLYEALPDVNRECDCVPNNMHDVTFASNTPLAGYEPPWVHPDDPAWQQNIGYQVAGLGGLALVGIIAFALFALVRWLLPQAPPDWRTAEE
jgi:cobalt/nickel transport system permease protein